MSDRLWRLLLKKPSDLSCEESFAVMEFYAGVLTQGGPELLPDVLPHLQGCPACPAEHRRLLERFKSTHEEGNGEPE